jgi:hypothetical protein
MFLGKVHVLCHKIGTSQGGDLIAVAICQHNKEDLQWAIRKSEFPVPEAKEGEWLSQ